MTITDARSALPRTSTPQLSGHRPVRRIATDFLSGMFLFNLAACALMPQSIDAFAATTQTAAYTATHSNNASGLISTGLTTPGGHSDRVLASGPHHFASILSGGHDKAGRPLPSAIGLILLSLVFAALTALNLQLVRHLREAYVPARRKKRVG